MPDWVRLLLMQARLTPDVLDVLLLHRKPLSFPVDHADLPSAHLTSRPLRQVTYGLLLSKGKHHQVTERDRDGLQLTFIPVKPVFTGLTKRLRLNSLDKVKLLGFYPNCASLYLVQMNRHFQRCKTQHHI